MSGHAHGLTQHAVHALPLIVVAVPLASRLPRWIRSRQGDGTVVRVQLLAALLLGSATIHALAAEDHRVYGVAAVTFFVLTAVVQLLLGLWVLARPGRAVLTATVLLSVGLLGLWWWSRTIGVPFGVEGGVVESIGWADLLSGATEVGAVWLCAGLLRTACVPAVRVRAEQLAWGLIVVAGTGMLVRA